MLSSFCSITSNVTRSWPLPKPHARVSVHVFTLPSSRRLAQTRAQAGLTIEHVRATNLIVCFAVGACDGSGPDPVYIPSLVYPQKLMVTEGASTTFVLSSSDFSHGHAAGMFFTYNDMLAATPSKFDLSPSSSSATITMTAAIDADSLNEDVAMDLYIYGAIGGESPVMRMVILDTNRPNVIASNWNITMSPASTTAVSVQLTQPAGAPLTVTLQSSDPGVANLAPTTMVFGAADYNMPQTATVTSLGTGTTSITLSSSSLYATAIFVTVE